MINGWFCRSIASDQGEQDYKNMVVKSETSEEEAMPVPEHLMDHRLRYKNLKKKLKFLVYENEFLSDTLRTSQHNFLKVAKDRTLLLDRLLQYEKPDMTSSDSQDETDSSEDEAPVTKKKKIEIVAPPAPQPQLQSSTPTVTTATYRQAVPLVKRKRVVPKKVLESQRQQQQQQQQQQGHSRNHHNHQQDTSNVRASAAATGNTVTAAQSNIMTTEEVERHLQSRQSLIELRAPPTVPTEMFSNEPSLDSEGDQLIEHSEDCLSMDMGMMQD